MPMPTNAMTAIALFIFLNNLSFFLYRSVLKVALFFDAKDENFVLIRRYARQN